MLLFWTGNLTDRSRVWELFCTCSRLCIFRVYISEMLKSSYICLVSIFQWVYFFFSIPTWTLLKLLPLFLLKPEVKSLPLKALSKRLVTNLSLSHCRRRCSPRHYRCYSQPLLILLAAMWLIDLCFYGLLIYIYIVGLTWLSAGRRFPSSVNNISWILEYEKGIK